MINIAVDSRFMCARKTVLMGSLSLWLSFSFLWNDFFLKDNYCRLYMHIRKKFKLCLSFTGKYLCMAVFANCFRSVCHLYIGSGYLQDLQILNYHNYQHFFLVSTKQTATIKKKISWVYLCFFGGALDLF